MRYDTKISAILILRSPTFHIVIYFLKKSINNISGIDINVY